ncbi:MAG: hypothetical protein ACK5D5_10715 [Bacteroidota bacterium]
MSAKKFIIISITVLAVIFNSCKTEFPTIAPYKEMVCVYGLIEQQQNINYIRINRVFQTEGNAYDAAQINDSVNFKQGELTVTLEKYRDGVFKASFPLSDTVLTTLPAGDFNTNQRLWVCYNQLASFGPGGTDEGATISYKLKIHNNITGKDFFGETKMVQDALVDVSAGGPLSGVSIGLTNPNFPVKLAMFNPQYGKLDNMILRFFYQEFPNVNDTTVYSDKFVDWNLGNQVVENINLTNTSVKYQFMGDDFYRFLTTVIQPDANVWARRARYIQVIFTSCGEEFQLFTEVNTPSNTIVQEKPVYSNITDGVGVFSSRSRYFKKLTLTPASIDKLAGTIAYPNSPSCGLQFLDSQPNGQKGPGCQ